MSMHDDRRADRPGKRLGWPELDPPRTASAEMHRPGWPDAEEMGETDDDDG